MGGCPAGTLGMSRSIQEEGGGELASGRQSDLRSWETDDP